MGKKVLRASVWTCRSLLFLYSKAIAFTFALFCVVSGIAAENAPIKIEKKTISGKAMMRTDSTVLKNIKLYLGPPIAAPVYGVGFGCYFDAFDSTVTDSAGEFVITYPESIFSNGSTKQSVIFAVKTDSESGAARFERFAAADPLYLNPQSDTTVTLYLEPYICTGVLPEKKADRPSIIKTNYGNTVSLKIGNWAVGGKYTASIVDISGKLIASPVISPDGILNWNTEKYSKGIYFINVETDRGILNTKIAVK